MQKTFLENPTHSAACKDFYEIFMHQKENVVFELLSLYSIVLISERANENIYILKNESDAEYKQRLEKFRWKNFDKFSED